MVTVLEDLKIDAIDRMLDLPMRLASTRPRLCREELFAQLLREIGPELMQHIDFEHAWWRYRPHCAELTVILRIQGHWPIETRLGFLHGRLTRTTWLEYCEDDPLCSQAEYRTYSDPGNAALGQVVYCKSFGAALVVAERHKCEELAG